MGNDIITLYAPHIEFSGTTKVMTTLAKEFGQRGYTVHMIRAHREWPPDVQSFHNVSIVTLPGAKFANWVDRPRSFRDKMMILAGLTIPSMVAYLRRERPKAVVMGLLTVPGIWAVKLAHVPAKSIISVQGLPDPRKLHHPLIQKYTYLMADAIIADCNAIGDALVKVSGIDSNRIRTIYNPVLDGSEIQKLQEPVTHPWFLDDGPPIILGVGRFLRQKDFPTLIQAFHKVRSCRPARLVILGDGNERASLEVLIRELGIENDVSLPGFDSNPFKYMRRANVFVLSSLWEGPGHVVIEALAAGVPIVATDCPAGPRETLLDGSLGTLVPVGDTSTMAEAILDVLEDQASAKLRADEGKKSLDRFKSGCVAEEYLRVIESL